MSKSPVLTINIDGAARGNPGPAAFAYVIARDGHPVVEDAGCLGETTNNVAEYTALVRALERASELGGQHLVIRSDSELLVKQMNGVYQVKNEQLRALHQQARRLLEPFASVSIRHVPRAQNSHADRLCNEALGKMHNSVAPAAEKGKTREFESSSVPEETAWEKVVSCLREAAAAWATGDPSHPSPEAIARRLRSILEAHGWLRRSDH